MPDAKALVMPSSRSELENLPEGLDLKQILFLQERDLLFSLEEWQQAMEPVLGGVATQTYLETGGWPEGLALAHSLVAQRHSSPLIRHPLCAARLGSLLPRDIPRETLVRLAQSPLLIREVYEILGLEEALVATLFDRGLLYAHGTGFALPRLLRLYLRGPTPVETVDALDSTLRAYGHFEAALELLAEHGLWERYLWLLIETFSSSWGDAYLRPQLSLVPPTYRNLPTYRYLNTFLARFAGDTEQMTRELEALLPLADVRLRPYVLNAYGVSLGMKAEYDKAIIQFQKSLEALSGDLSKVRGDALHNLGLAHYYTGSLGEARQLLFEAAALYRKPGDYELEAGSLVSLSAVENSLGNPQAARSAVARALPNLASQTDICLAKENKANAWVLMGDFSRAVAHLLPFLEVAKNHRVNLILKLSLANVYRWQGHFSMSQSLVEEVLRSSQMDQQLLNEANLLLCKIAFQRNKPDLAKAYLGKVSGDFRAIAESAWQGLTDLDEAIAEMRERKAKFELAQLLLRKGDLGSLREALELCQTHQYGLLMQHPYFAPYWRPLVIADEGVRRAFPIRLQTFGAFGVELLGMRRSLAEGFKTRKAALLLIYLALNPRPHHRERLAEIFWSDATNPLASLNTAISELRRLFGVPVIGGNKRKVGLGFPVWSDLSEFLDATEPYLKQPILARSKDLEALLRRFEVEWLPELPDWFAEERLALEARQAKLWRMLAEHYQGSAPQKAIEAYCRALDLEPYVAEAWAQLVELYNSLGEPILAQQARARMRKALQELHSSMIQSG
ncbi:MAG: SARP family transcriptional regulator [Meiothermus sp.]|nr:SARP family transcriptional regulator [Meiothermus sp.]